MKKIEKIQAELSVEIVTEDSAIADTAPASGWGEGANKCTVNGKVMSVTIEKDNDVVVWVRIMEGGNLLVQVHGSYTMSLQRGIRYNNNHPWTKETS